MNIFYDKYGREIKSGNILVFGNGHEYKVNVYNGIFYIGCISKKMPTLRLDKIFFDKVISDAYIMD